MRGISSEKKVPWKLRFNVQGAKYDRWILRADQDGGCDVPSIDIVGQHLAESSS